MNLAEKYARRFWEADALDHFDLDIVGVNCGNIYEPHEWPQPWRCPFKPGCGVTVFADCPARKQRAAIPYTSMRLQ